MPEPASRRKSNYATEPTFNELIWAQQQEIGKRMDRLEKSLDNTRKELSDRMDRIEKSLDRVDARLNKQDEKFDKLADKIDDLHKEIKSSTNHGQIASISTIGIAIAVIYSLLR